MCVCVLGVLGVEKASVATPPKVRAPAVKSTYQGARIQYQLLAQAYQLLLSQPDETLSKELHTLSGLVANTYANMKRMKLQYRQELCTRVTTKARRQNKQLREAYQQLDGITHPSMKVVRLKQQLQAELKREQKLVLRHCKKVDVLCKRYQAETLEIAKAHPKETKTLAAYVSLKALKPEHKRWWLIHNKMQTITNKFCASPSAKELVKATKK